MNKTELELLRATSSRKFAEEMQAELAKLLSKEMDKTITRTAVIHIAIMYRIGMDYVFPKTFADNQSKEAIT